MDDHLYLVTYDISDPKRWRAVYELMNGHGEWLQLSVFQCRLNKRRHADLVSMLDQLIHHQEDDVLIIDIGVADHVSPRIISLGKSNFEAVKREAIVV